MKSWTVAAIYWLHLCFSAVTLAADSNWTNPNGQLPSFASTYIVGEQIIISWMPLNDSKTFNDLWLTRYDTTTDDFALRLAVSLDISKAGSWNWVVALQASEVVLDTRFLLQFLPTGAAYDPHATPSLPSPGFNLINVNMGTPPNGTASHYVTGAVTPTGSSSSTATASVPSNSTTDLPGSSEPSNGHELGTGALIGVIAACTFVVMVAIAGIVAGLMIHKRRQARRRSGLDPSEKVVGPYEVLGDSKSPIELSSRDSIIPEAPKDNMIHELGVVIIKPGLHEMAG